MKQSPYALFSLCSYLGVKFSLISWYLPRSSNPSLWFIKVLQNLKRKVVASLFHHGKSSLVSKTIEKFIDRLSQIEVHVLAILLVELDTPFCVAGGPHLITFGFQFELAVSLFGVHYILEVVFFVDIDIFITLLLGLSNFTVPC